MAALALKYRPDSFNDLVGQLHAARSLRNALESGHLHHAYLFYGSRGVGKTSTARIVAKCVNCVKGPTPEPCGECENCIEIKNGSSIDVIEMDAASNRGIEHIRELRENARFSPMKSRNKVYIIDEVHMLTSESFNALLKTLEEPPAHVIFILATTEYHKIPETILSRCQAYAFRKFSEEDLLKRLDFILKEETIGYEDGALLPVARKAEGSMRDSLSLLDQVIAFSGREQITVEAVNRVLGTVRTETFGELLEGIRRKEITPVLKIIEDLSAEGFNLRHFLWDFLNFIKDLSLITHEVDTARLGLTASRSEDLKQYAANWDAGMLQFVFKELYQIYSNWALFNTSRSSEIRISLEMALLELFDRLRAPSLSGLLKKIENLKNTLESGQHSDPEKKKLRPGSEDPPSAKIDPPEPVTTHLPPDNDNEPREEYNPDQDLDHMIKSIFMGSEEDPGFSLDLFRNSKNKQG